MAVATPRVPSQLPDGKVLDEFWAGVLKDASSLLLNYFEIEFLQGDITEATYIKLTQAVLDLDSALTEHGLEA
jgi:hypothetical protein